MHEHSDTTLRRTIILLSIFLISAVIVVLSTQLNGVYSIDTQSSFSEALESAPASKQANISMVETEMQIQVKKCALQITGDDKPRKLDTELRAKVMECAFAYMPPLDTDSLLHDSERELMSAAQTAEQKKEAQQIIAVVHGDDTNAALTEAPISKDSPLTSERVDADKGSSHAASNAKVQN